MNISKVGIDLIKSFEGVRLVGYADIVGVPTIGYGHTGNVKVGQKITQAQADQLLKDDLKRFVDGVNSLVKVPLNQNQFDSLVSWSFNLGLGALKSSTLLKKLNAKDYKGASLEFPKWNKAGGKVVSGLTRRRLAEKSLFIKKVPIAVQPVAKIPYPNYLVKKGSNPNSVKMVQKKLGLKQDGIYGSATEKAVKSFQTKHKLTSDGIVGKDTWNKLFN
jgi:lysozyme